MDTTIRVDRRFAILEEWILDSDISDRAVRLYAVLMRYADKHTLKAFPSRGTIAKRLRCSKASVDRAIDELVKIGALEKEHRFNSSIMFTLHTYPQGGGDTGVPTVTGDEGGSSPVMRGVLTGDDLTKVNELKPVNDIFARFWSTYPRKVGKQAAQRAFEKAISKYDVNVILEGLDRMVADPNLPDKQFLPHPSTWLNEGRWEDEAYPQRERDGRPLKPAAQVPGHRDWVRVEHDAGEHWACKPGEFGCK